MTKFVLIDTCIWISFYEKQREPERYRKARDLLELTIDQNLIVPWPTLYEFVNTRFAKRKERITSFKDIIKKENVLKLDDFNYKNSALQKFFDINEKSSRSLSLVDLIIREIISDINVKIDYLLTFNTDDFADLCYKRQVEILSVV